MCLVLIFNIAIPKQKPVKAEGVLATGVYLFFVACCEKLGIDLIVDNEGTINAFKGFWSDVCDGFNEMSESVKETFETCSTAWNGIYPVVVSVAKEKFVEVGVTIADWFTEKWSSFFGGSGGNTYSPTATLGTVTPLNEDGYVGFTDETAFTFSYPNENLNFVYYPFNNCNLFVYNRFSQDDLPDSYTFSYGNISDFWGSVIVADNGLSFYSIYKNWFHNSIAGSNFSFSWDNFHLNSWYSCSNSKFPKVFYTYDTTSSNSSNSVYTNFFYKDGVVYSIINSGNKYYLADSNGVRYDDNEFDSSRQLTNWFRQLCGFVTSSTITDTDIPYNPDQEQEEDRPGIISGPDIDLQVRDYINSIPDDATVDLTVAGTIDQAATIDDTSPIIYPGQLDLPSVHSDMWYDRFPFCVPFDIINLFTQFGAEAEAPRFHILVLPENSFGLNNEDIYFDIDFSQYHILVKILRIFLAAGFALWLLSITRKVIGS